MMSNLSIKNREKQNLKTELFQIQQTTYARTMYLSISPSIHERVGRQHTKPLIGEANLQQPLDATHGMCNVLETYWKHIVAKYVDVVNSRSLLL